jgi:hypothetical protein
MPDLKLSPRKLNNDITFVPMFRVSQCGIILASLRRIFMDVLEALSCVLLFMAAGPFLDKLFLTRNKQSERERTS